MATKTWAYRPQKKSSPKVSDRIKGEVKLRVDNLIESVLKPKYIKPPPKDSDFNYLVDIFSKWYRHYFYFCSKYNCPGPNALAPSFDSKFARLEYVGPDEFNLAYMRHTGQWFEVDSGLSLEECLRAIETWGHFIP